MASTAVAVALPSAAFAQGAPETYTVTGSELGSTGNDYTGTVVVRRTGATWQLVWRIGNETVTGTGIIMNGIHYAAAGNYRGKPYVFLMRKEGNRYVGQWTQLGEARIGHQTWTPK